MKRLSDEDGQSAGFRNAGRFFLAAIPAVLGLGGIAWFTLWVMGYDFQKQKEAEKHELTQQERSAVYVGAADRPKGKLAIQMEDRTCMHPVRADIDTRKRGYPYDESDFEYSLILYGQNACGRKLTYVSWHWQSLSPNGTVLKSNYENSCPIPGVMEIAECRFTIARDERIDKIRVWIQDQPY